MVVSDSDAEYWILDTLQDNKVVYTGARFDIKMSSYQDRNSHYKDKTASRPAYLSNENPHK